MFSSVSGFIPWGTENSKRKVIRVASEFGVVWAESLTRFGEQVFDKVGFPAKDAHTAII
jgi:hypothetical protein